MITPDQLKQFNELVNADDARLLAGIDRAYKTITRYIPDYDRLGVLAHDVIDGVALVLARAYIADSKALGDEHPLVRDMKESLEWLSLVSSGKLSLPKDPETEIPAPATGAFVVMSSSGAFPKSVLDRMVL